MDLELAEVTKKKELVFKGGFLELYSDQVILPNQKTATREYINHPGSVAAVPVLANGDIILVKQFRYPAGATILEIPAGKLEPGENPEEAISRELAEEIGYIPKKVQPLLSTWTSPGYSNEIIHLFLATDLYPKQKEPDDDEFLQLVKLNKSEVRSLLTTRQITDGKTYLALAIMELNNLW